MVESDVLVIGSGIAGAIAAIRAAEKGLEVVLITKSKDPSETTTSFAQGGIVYRGDGDTPELLVQDILNAGGGASNPDAARILAVEGPRLVEEYLINKAGVEFDRRETGEYDLAEEGAHSVRRILHVGDRTGAVIQEALFRYMRGVPNIRLYQGHVAVDLITPEHHSRDPLDVYAPDRVIGAYALNVDDKKVHRFMARAVILATGGLGQVYLHTTNPRGATGDGFAMAYRAGARLINMEYIQFHPTAFYTEEKTTFLITEALRGEGAILKTPDGRSFMEDYHELGSLAPRDVVARAIHEEITQHGYPYVLLDAASYIPAEKLKTRFPTIYKKCLENGIDITKEPIPVVPAVHFACGGVKVDLFGRTILRGLYAAGEVACTGVHGANRLASTSLLEGLVFGVRAADAASRELPELESPRYDIPEWIDEGLEEADPALIHQDWDSLKHIMCNYVGIVRTTKRLKRAVLDLRHLWLQVEDFYRQTKLSRGLIELRNGIQTALVIARSALRNRVSRGAHFRKD